MKLFKVGKEFKETRNNLSEGENEVEIDNDNGGKEAGCGWGKSEYKAFIEE